MLHPPLIYLSIPPIRDPQGALTDDAKSEMLAPASCYSLAPATTAASVVTHKASGALSRAVWAHRTLCGKLECPSIPRVTPPRNTYSAMAT